MTRWLAGSAASGRPWGRRALGVAVAVATVSGAVACGSAGATTSPSTELRSAVADLGNAQVVTATIDLAASAQQLRHRLDSAHQRIDPRIAKLASGAKAVLEVRAPDGKTISDLRGSGSTTGQSRFFLRLDGEKVVQARAVAKKLYLRAEVDKLAQLANAKDDLAELKKQVPHGFHWAQAGLAGDWVSLDRAAAKDLGGGAFSAATPSAGAGLLQQLRTVLRKDVTVRRAGTSDAGDHLVLTGNIRTIGRDLLTKIRKLTPGAANFPIRTDNLPDKKVHLNAYVDDGTLSRLSLNLAQFGGGPKMPDMHGANIPLRIDVDQSGASVHKPSHAAPVDVPQLLSVFSHLVQSKMSAST